MLAEEIVLTESTVYWITRLDSVKEVAGAGGVVFIVILLMIIIIALLEDTSKKYVWGLSLGLIMSILIAVSSLFIPTTKEYCAIKVIPMIVNNDEIQAVPDKVLELATKWVEELRPNKDN